MERNHAAKAAERRAIYDLQNMLYVIARKNGTAQVIPDGIFGERTAQVVRSFQKQNGLPVSGEVDYNTWEAIAGQYRQVCSELAPSQKINLFPDKSKMFQSGDQCNSVYAVQMIFKKMAQQYKEYEDCEICGKLNETTVKNLKQFQKTCGMQGDGTLDCKTWDQLVQYYNLFEV